MSGKNNINVNIVINVNKVPYVGIFVGESLESSMASKSGNIDNRLSKLIEKPFFIDY